MAEKPYDVVIYHGKKLDRFSVQRLQAAEKRLGYDLTIIQGSYNTGVGASAGTHDRGGAVDLSAWDWENKVRILRQEGWAAWLRPTIPGLWNAHIHAILYDNKHLSSGAKVQRTEYYNGYDGLAGSGRDPHHRPSPIPHFRWKKPKKKPKPRHPKPWGEMVNRARSNRSIKKPGKHRGDAAMNDLRVIRNHIRKHTKYTVDGFAEYPESRIYHALLKIADDHKLKGKNAKGLLTRKLSKILGIRSRWVPLPSWGKKNRPAKPFEK